MNNVFTFGCRLNFWESEKINQILKENNQKNITVFNTCSVTNEAVKNIISNIKKSILEILISKLLLQVVQLKLI